MLSDIKKVIYVLYILYNQKKVKYVDVQYNIIHTNITCQFIQGLRELRSHLLASHGYVVVCIDNRGS